MLKTGSDAFLETGQAATVAVCNQRYVFNPSAMNSDLDPSGHCPPDVNVPTDVAAIRAPQSASAIAAPGQPSAVYQDPFVQKIQEILREH
jgi:murein L,D-transpeptidase YafK